MQLSQASQATESFIQVCEAMPAVNMPFSKWLKTSVTSNPGAFDVHVNTLRWKVSGTKASQEEKQSAFVWIDWLQSDSIRNHPGFDWGIVVMLAATQQQ